MPAAINSKRIGPEEYGAILSRVRKLGRDEATLRQIATEFNRGVTTIRRLAGKLGR